MPARWRPLVLTEPWSSPGGSACHLPFLPGTAGSLPPSSAQVLGRSLYTALIASGRPSPHPLLARTQRRALADLTMPVAATNSESAMQQVLDNLGSLPSATGAAELDLIFLRGIMESPIVRSLAKGSTEEPFVSSRLFGCLHAVLGVCLGSVVTLAGLKASDSCTMLLSLAIHPQGARSSP
ncbi:MAGUK p55 subfamily member 2 [Fukomys damarensis]|uniref:MAGUK p55 subfamily member 2 n=1 Tax=Fukomys damarensis TaxID=885580 RepID=UPI00053F6019|nr:MAGUK p55 subfamily member 2 [Fukomys damarensis]